MRTLPQQLFGDQRASPEKTFYEDMDIDQAEETEQTDMHTGFNGRPEEISVTIWRAIKHLHRALDHPGKVTLIRLLRRYRTSSMAIPAAELLKFSLCLEHGRPGNRRRVAIDRGTEFNERVQLDGFEVIMTDGSSVYLFMIDSGRGVKVWSRDTDPW